MFIVRLEDITVQENYCCQRLKKQSLILYHLPVLIKRKTNASVHSFLIPNLGKSAQVSLILNMFPGPYPSS